jgi:parallel beta-helix repeat protein
VFVNLQGEGTMSAKALIGLLITLLTFTTISFAVQVDGYCYLENQSNHAGTKALFQADHSGAVTDSTFTDTSGYYDIDLAEGVYDVFYSHEGFGNARFYERFFYEPITLPNVTLMDTLAWIRISGALSGVLEDTTYAVEGNIYVEEGSTLSIMPGAIFYFLGDQTTYFVFGVLGQLNAIGTEQDSIKFMAAPTSNGWAGIYFNSPVDNYLEYCVITGVAYTGRWAALELVSSNNQHGCTISHCTVTQNLCYWGAAIGCGPGIHHISYCTITQNNAYMEYINEGAGIWCEHSDEAYINHCDISSNIGSGIICNGNNSVSIANCIITGNSEAGILFDSDQGTAISNCTIRGNTYGFFCFRNSRPSIVNTIVEGNSTLGIYFLDSPNVSVTYGDFHGNVFGDFGGTSAPPQLGQLVMVNANGDSCDIYANIFLDPLFVNPSGGDYHVQTASPCIDAGDPQSPLDPDSTVADIGAFYFDQSSQIQDHPKTIQPFAFRLFPNYPNPFNASTILSFSIPIIWQVNLSVFDITGRHIATVVSGQCQSRIHRFRFDGTGLASGIYFYRLIAGNFTDTKKMVLVK